MILGNRRAACLAAVALVVQAREPVPVLLRRLVAEDPPLRRLIRVAESCERGHSLAQGLAAAGLITASLIPRLDALTPAALANELGLLAQEAFARSPGELAADGMPVWCLLAANAASLAIGSVVALVAQAGYPGALAVLQGSARHTPVSWWWQQLSACLLAAAALAACWWVLRSIPGVRRITIFSTELERAINAHELVRGLRADPGSPRLRRWFARWRWYSGDRHGITRALAEAGGDLLATAMAVGLIPRRRDGTPDWDHALAEAADHRQRAATRLLPALLALFIAVGVAGLLDPALKCLRDVLPMLELAAGLRESHWLTTQVFWVLGSLGLVVAAHAQGDALKWLDRLRGPARDWPLVADRVARCVDGHGDHIQVLRGLRLLVGAPMRRALDRCLMGGHALPGLALASAGAVPQAQAGLIARADGPHLALALRASIAGSLDQQTRTALGHALMIVAILLLVIGMLQGYLSQAILPHHGAMLDALGQDWSLSSTLVTAATNVVMALVPIAIASVLIGCLGIRFGWWHALSGGSRLARGLVIRRCLDVGMAEPEIAATLVRLWPATDPAVRTSAERGDLASMLRAAGWPARQRVDLTIQVESALRRRERRQVLSATGLRLLLPMVLALPVGLTAAAVMLSLTQLQTSTLRLAAGSTGGGTPAMALMGWLIPRFEAAVVDPAGTGQPPGTTP